MRRTEIEYLVERAKEWERSEWPYCEFARDVRGGLEAMLGALDSAVSLGGLRLAELDREMCVNGELYGPASQWPELAEFLPKGVA